MLLTNQNYACTKRFWDNKKDAHMNHSEKLKDGLSNKMMMTFLLFCLAVYLCFSPVGKLTLTPSTALIKPVTLPIIERIRSNQNSIYI